MTISHRTQRLAAMAVGALFLASCGSSGSNDTATTTTTKATTTTSDGSAKTTTSSSTATTLTVAQAWTVDAQEHRAEIGKTFEYDCQAGGEADRIWGVETYTDDSSVCTAAVHVGLITFAKGGKVEIEMVEAPGSYESGSANGVESIDYGSWPGAFTFPEAPPGTGTFTLGTRSWSLTANGLSLKVGDKRPINCSGGGTIGSVWGTGTYTADSSICSAAVHAGLIDQAKGGEVTIEVVAGTATYEGSTAHGVTTSSYGAYDPAYRFVP